MNSKSHLMSKTVVEEEKHVRIKKNQKTVENFI